MKKIGFLLLLSLFSTVLSGQTLLEYNLNEGDVFTVRQEAQQIIVQNLDGASHEITNNIIGLIEFKVVQALEDTYQIELRFKDLNLNMTSSIQGLLMDVKAKEVAEDDTQAKIFNSLLDIPVQMTLAKNGDILSVVGGDSLVNKMTDASGLEDEFSKNIMKKSLEKEFGSEALSNSYKQMTYIYSSNKINIGDSWNNEYAGKLIAKNTWTLDTVTPKNATISGIAEIIMNVTEPATTMKLTGTQETKVTTDIISGFVLKMKVDGFSEGISTITQMGNQEIPTTIKSTTTYELIKE